MRIILYLLCFGLSVGHTFAFYERCGRTDTQYLQSSCARFKRRLDCGILYSLVWPLSSSTANNTENTAKRPALKGIVRVGAVSADEHKSLAAQYNIKAPVSLSNRTKAMTSFGDEIEGLSADGDFQKSIAAQQAQMEFQQQINKLSDICWEKCVTDAKMSSKFSKGTDQCLTNCAARFIDTSIIVTRKFAPILEKTIAKMQSGSQLS